MKNKKKILLVGLILILGLTACSSDKGEKATNLEAESKLSREAKLLKKLEKNDDPETYIELADIYRDEGNFSKEEKILISALGDNNDSRKIRLRSAEFDLFAGNKSYGRLALNNALEEEFDEDILAMIYRDYIDSDRTSYVEKYYDDYHDRITSLETKMLAYESMAYGSSSYLDELRQELLDSKDMAAYETLLRAGYRHSKFDDIDYILSELKAIGGDKELINIYSALASLSTLEESFHIVDSEIGHFTGPDKRSLAIAYKKNYSDREIYLALFDPSVNELIYDEMMEDPYPEFLVLNSFNNGDKDLLSMPRFSGVSASAGVSHGLYEFVDGRFINLRQFPENDLELILLDDFKIEIKSEDLKRNYIVDIPKEDRLAYISIGQYNESGEALEEYPIYMTDNFFVTSSKDYGEFLVMDIGFGGTLSYSAERLASIRAFYDFIDGEFKLVHFTVDTDAGFVSSYSINDGFYTIKKELEEYPKEDKDVSETQKFFDEHLSEDDFILVQGDKSFNVNQSINRITDVLGEGQVEHVEDINEYADMYRYDNDGIKIFYTKYVSPDESKVFNNSIIVTDPGIKTLRGLEVGQDIDKLEELYGLPEIFYEGDGQVIYDYREEESYNFMELYVIVDQSTDRIVEYYFSFIL